MTLIEKCCIGWIVSVIVGLITMSAKLAFGADTSTAAMAQDAVQFAVKQISESPDLYGVGAGLVVLLGVLLRNPAVRAALPILLEWIVSLYTRPRDAHRARKAKRKAKHS